MKHINKMNGKGIWEMGGASIKVQKKQRKLETGWGKCLKVTESEEEGGKEIKV
jgi:hypothetical protein